MKSPIFIFGSVRSETSLLSRIVANDLNITIPVLSSDLTAFTQIQVADMRVVHFESANPEAFAKGLKARDLVERVRYDLGRGIRKLINMDHSYSVFWNSPYKVYSLLDLTSKSL